MLTQLDTRAMLQNFSTLHLPSLKRTNLQYPISGIYIYIHVYGWHLVLCPAISGSFLSALHDLESKCWKSYWTRQGEFFRGRGGRIRWLVLSFEIDSRKNVPSWWCWQLFPICILCVVSDYQITPTNHGFLQ